MWKCRPTSSRCRALAPAARSPRAPASIEKPNFESAWPVEIAWCVSPATPGVTRISTSWRAPRSAATRSSRSRSSKRVEHDVADAGLERLAQLALGLGVAVQVDPRRVEAAAQRERELAAGGDVAGQALLGQHPVDRRAGERLGGEQHVEVVVAGGQRVEERAGAGAQVVLGHDVRRRAELARELDRVAAADLEAAALVDAGARAG